MPVIICTKFEINRVIVAFFPGVWDKNSNFNKFAISDHKALKLDVQALRS